MSNEEVAFPVSLWGHLYNLPCETRGGVVLGGAGCHLINFEID